VLIHDIPQQRFQPLVETLEKIRVNGYHGCNTAITFQIIEVASRRG